MHTLLVAIIVSLCTIASAEGKNVVPTPRRRLSNLVHIMKPLPSNVQLQQGDKLVLKCEVIGRPSPTVQWMKNGEAISNSVEDSHDILPVHPSSSANLISQLVVTTAATGDVFTCVATSGVNRDTASTTVNVVEGQENHQNENMSELSKPLITSYFNNVYQNSGTNILLPCRVNSTSIYQTYWEHNMENALLDNRMQVLPSGDLLVARLQSSDLGTFTCIVKNRFGSDVISTLVYPLRVE